MKLINADTLMSKAFTDERGYNVVYVDDIFKEPAVDAEPVKHGWWIKLDRDIAVCSECGRHENALLVDSYPYCHCGAKMDLKDSGNE